MENESVNIKLIIIGILLVSTLYIGTTNDFLPKHVAYSYTIKNTGHMGWDYLSVQVPGFYIIGATIANIAALSPPEFIYFPINTGLIVVLLAVFTRFSRQELSLKIISGTAVMLFIVYFIYLLNLSTANDFQFWADGLGMTIYYSIIIIIFDVLSNKSSFKLPLVILLIIMVISLTFISYNYEARFILFTIIVIGLLHFMEYQSGKKQISKVLSLIIIIELGIKKFLYDVYIPSEMHYLKNGILMSATSKLLSMFFGQHSNSGISRYLFSAPPELTLVYLVKYTIVMALLGITILWVVCGYLNKCTNIKKERGITISVFLYIALLTEAVIWIIIRAQMGGVPIPNLFLPSLLGTLVLFQYFNKKLKIISAILLVTLLVIVILNQYIILSNDVINRDTTFAKEYYAPSMFYLSKVGTTETLVSDEYTKDIILAYISYVSRTKNPTRLFRKFKLITINELIDITLPTISDKPWHNNEIFIINFNLHSSSINNWIVIKSWINYISEISVNPNYNTIYSNTQVIMLKRR